MILALEAEDGTSKGIWVTQTSDLQFGLVVFALDLAVDPNGGEVVLDEEARVSLWIVDDALRDLIEGNL